MKLPKIYSKIHVAFKVAAAKPVAKVWLFLDYLDVGKSFQKLYQRIKKCPNVLYTVGNIS